MWKKILLFLPGALLLSGCVGTFTNLTPLQQTRNANNLYPVEVAFNTSQQSFRWESIQPYVLADGQPYSMRPTPLMQNRWEGFVPALPGTNVVMFRYKFDYKYNNLGSAPKSDSVYSPEYKLSIVDQ
ncbi:MAG: hypothetical protein ABSG87_07000 [Verrucomicrobiota bacterium]|jgi:hypothetical protein